MVNKIQLAEWFLFDLWKISKLQLTTFGNVQMYFFDLETVLIHKIKT